MEPRIQKHHHHILPTRVALVIGGALIFLTFVTVWVAHIDLGSLNFPIAMAVATTKALLVAMFFMNLLYDRRENAMIFATSFLFLAIFIVLTGTDLFFRGDVYVKGPLFIATDSKSQLKDPWVSTPQLVAKGKELYAAQCVSCHGAEGRGDGPAAPALNPPPRNFHEEQGWKNGRKPTMVFKTLKEGLPPSAMASYESLPSDDRWALVHYVLSMGSKPQEDTPADFAKVGIDPTKAGGGEAEGAKTIPLYLAIERMIVPEIPAEAHAETFSPLASENVALAPPLSRGREVYQANCLQCHGAKGEGGIRVATLGADPVAYVSTRPFQLGSDNIKSEANFNQLVEAGMPGRMMPGFGQLSSEDLKSLYEVVKEFAAASR